VLQAILLSEKSRELQERALSVVPSTLDTLLATGAFAEADSLLESLSMAAREYEETPKMLAERVTASLNVPVRVALISVGLANAPAQPPGLAELLQRLSPAAAPSLCTVLAEAEKPSHRQILRETIGRLCSEHPEPVLGALLDPRTEYVRDLIAIVAAWDLPRTTQALGTLARHPDVGVRIEAVNALAQLAFGGDGRALFAFAFDEEQQVRQRALRQLGSGNYQLSFEFWRPKLLADDINAVPISSRRALLTAVQATSGDSSIPFLASLLRERGWTQRKEREETALLAVQTLAAMNTPRAKAVMREAITETSGAVKKALIAALEGLGK
jgi:HEAT repeat protein